MLFPQNPREFNIVDFPSVQKFHFFKFENPFDELLTPLQALLIKNKRLDHGIFVLLFFTLVPDHGIKWRILDSEWEAPPHIGHTASVYCVSGSPTIVRSPRNWKLKIIYMYLAVCDKFWDWIRFFMWIMPFSTNTNVFRQHVQCNSQDSFYW